MTRRAMKDWSLYEVDEAYGLSVRARSALRNAMCQNAEDIARLTEKDLLAMPNVGRKTLMEIRELRFLMANACLLNVEDMGPYQGIAIRDGMGNCVVAFYPDQIDRLCEDLMRLRHARWGK